MPPKMVVACHHYWDGSTWVPSTDVGGASGSGDVSTATAPAAGSSALIVRLPAPLTDSTNNAIRVFQVASSGGASSTEVIVRQSTAADLQMTATPAAGSTWNVRALQSSAADFNVSAVQGSTVWQTQTRVFTSSGGGVEGSTTTPSTGSVLGFNVRMVQPSGRQSTSVLANIGTAGGSTALISSVAAVKHKVYAFSVTSTVVGPSSCAFVSSAAIERWGLIIGSQSSGVTGANLAIPPPGFLFETETANALNFLASSTGLYRVSLSWFTEA